jgi:diaminopimelate epimerase
MIRLGLMDDDVQVQMPGGTLRVQVGQDWAVTLTGPVAEIGMIDVSGSLLG